MLVGLYAGTGFGLAVALGASNTLETLTVNQYFHMLYRVALHLKVTFHTLKLPAQADDHDSVPCFHPCLHGISVAQCQCALRCIAGCRHVC